MPEAMLHVRGNVQVAQTPPLSPHAVSSGGRPWPMPTQVPTAVRQHSVGAHNMVTPSQPMGKMPPSSPGKPPPAPPPPVLPPMQAPASTVVSHMFDAHEVHSEPGTPWPHCWPLCAAF